MNHRVYGYAIPALIFLFFFAFNGAEAVSAPAPSGTASGSTVPGTLGGGKVIGGGRKQSPQSLRPNRILIPSIRVNAEIIDIGVTKTNNLDVPSNYYQAGWYKYGSLPGNPGNAVIDGHVDNGGRIDGPFKHLKETKVGDDIYVVMTDGSIVAYTIKDLSTSSYKKFPKESVFRGNEESVLKIITCHGKFLKSEDTYDQRLIVTAVKKSHTLAAVK